MQEVAPSGIILHRCGHKMSVCGPRVQVVVSWPEHTRLRAIVGLVGKVVRVGKIPFSFVCLACFSY